MKTARRSQAAPKPRKAKRRASTRRGYSYSLSFFLRASSTFRPSRLANSFRRKGYHKTRTNPNGYHWAVDAPAPAGTMIQLPAKAKLRAKGHDSEAGYWMEWEFLEGPWIHRFGRWFHMDRPCGHSVGAVRARRFAIGHVGKTGNATGTHAHFELGKYAWSRARDPRWDPEPAMNLAISAKDY